MPDPSRTIRVVDRDGDIVELVADGPHGPIEVIAEMTLSGDVLTLRGLHADGAGPGSLGLSEVREFARELGRQKGARIVEIHGAKRTTGARRGKVPRPIRIEVGPMQEEQE